MLSFSVFGAGVVALILLATVPVRRSRWLSQGMLPALAGALLTWLLLVAVARIDAFEVLFPLRMFLPDHQLERWMPFMQGPLVSGVLALCLAAGLVGWPLRARQKGAWATLGSSMALSVVFLGATLAHASFKAERQITEAAGRLHPVCFQRVPFWSSLGQWHGHVDAHALVKTADGRQHYWSYADQAFFLGNAQLDPNFQCHETP